MYTKLLHTAILLVSLGNNLVYADCDSHSPAFALPSLNPDDAEIRQAYHGIKKAVEDALRQTKVNSSSYSIAVTSSTETLFEIHHSAKVRDNERPGAEVVDGSSVYRVASNTKAFTVLALLQLQKKGKVNLDDPINKYLLRLDKDQTGSLPWKDITLRTLASQLSGIPRNLGMVDLKDNAAAWPVLGLPDLSEENQVICDSIWNYTKRCTVDDLYSFLGKAEPLLAPKQQSTYGNINYLLLGQVIQKVSGVSYEDYIAKNILQELEMSSTTFKHPSDAHAVIPKGMASFFDMDIGLQNPTGGLYSTTDDMSKWARYILTHYNGLSPVVNWLNPQSFATGMNSFVGMPWEIFRSNEVLSYTDRPVTLVTKGGGWPGYVSITAMVPEYGIGFVVLLGSSDFFDNFIQTINGIVGQHVVEAADRIAHKQLSHQHTGTFSTHSDDKADVSITFSHTKEKGLFVSSWTSNLKDVLAGFRSILMAGDDDTPSRLQLLPTLLFKDEKRKAGEIWRIVNVKGENPKKLNNGGPLTKNFCITDIDTFAYGGKPLLEVVFWSKDTDGVYQTVELIGWRTKLDRVNNHTMKLTDSRFQLVGYEIPGQHILRRLFSSFMVD